ncbi:hypothetical protein PM082_002366 [Marasmius tenuissimus]|nr:hypothetical protein PM082_002366 [Marasmius tenuissimus]
MMSHEADVEVAVDDDMLVSGSAKATHGATMNGTLQGMRTTALDEDAMRGENQRDQRPDSTSLVLMRRYEGSISFEKEWKD